METEESILLSYFFNSELQDSITLQQFTKKFPLAYRSNPQIKTLYKEYHEQRIENRKLVRKNTIEECQKPDQWNDMKISRKREREDDTEAEDEDDRLSLGQVIGLLSIEEKSILKEIDFMKKECKRLLQDIRRTNGNMSDLRYGKVPAESLGEDEVVNGLKGLVFTCDSSSSSD
ncbi:8656_t:CDS:2 [Acaulospora morrowiae]|uniref:8656_t:CDS:1 n=1 Tax=Acaulospora morrowiae TaxID=94023 RepID=A0A9N8VUB2_9GLOM|nr:8656_t:CDS:2 [Acaulospora morrowiae]